MASSLDTIGIGKATYPLITFSVDCSDKDNDYLSLVLDCVPTLLYPLFTTEVTSVVFSDGQQMVIAPESLIKDIQGTHLTGRIVI